jgi:nucleotide-binding universal stress UspA family protein
MTTAATTDETRDQAEPLEELDDERSSAGAPGILVGIDGSDTATAALHWAAAEAELRAVPLVIANVYTARVGGYPTELPVTVFEVLRKDSAQILAEAGADVRERHPEVQVTTVTRSGGAIPLLVQEAHGKELAVIGSRGLGGFTGLLLGSVGMGLATHAPCPVAVIRGDAAIPVSGAPAPIVVGVDGSHEADQAVQAAFHEAQLRRSPLRIVHCWQDPTTDRFTTAAGRSGSLAEFDEQAWKDRAAATLDESLREARNAFPEVPVEAVVDWRRPTVALLERAAGAQLLVVGSRGRGAFKGLVLGSTSRVMIQHAPCPVLVVRARG